MDMQDALTLDGTRITADGYLVTSVKVARTGIQTYLGREVDPENAHGMRDRVSVNVYRPPETVFDEASLVSLAYKPVTIDHPKGAVTADNWKEHSVGIVGGEIAKDGNFIRVPLSLMDAQAIRDVQARKRELSAGYSCDLEWTPGTTPEGLAYDCKQVNVRFNHVSCVDTARGGPELKIGDSKPMKTILVDGHSVEMSEAAAIAVAGLTTKFTDAQTANAKLTADLATANTQIGTLTATVATKDGEIAAKDAQLKDAAITPEKLDAAVAARALVVDAAKIIMPTLDPKGKTDAAIRREAVTARLGDQAKTLDDNGVLGAFTALTADAKPRDQVADALSGITPATVTDAAVNDARANYIKSLQGGKAA